MPNCLHKNTHTHIFRYHIIIFDITPNYTMNRQRNEHSHIKKDFLIYSIYVFSDTADIQSEVLKKTNIKIQKKEEFFAEKMIIKPRRNRTEISTHPLRYYTIYACACHRHIVFSIYHILLHCSNIPYIIQTHTQTFLWYGCLKCKTILHHCCRIMLLSFFVLSCLLEKFL